MTSWYPQYNDERSIYSQYFSIGYQYYLAVAEDGLTITPWELPDPERDLPRPLSVLGQRNVHLLHVIGPVVSREETTEETANFVKDLSSLSAVGILHLNI